MAQNYSKCSEINQAINETEVAFSGFPDSHTRQGSSPGPIDWKWTGGRASGSTKLSTSDLFGEQVEWEDAVQRDLAPRHPPTRLCPFVRGIYERYQMPPRISIRGSVRPLVRPSARDAFAISQSFSRYLGILGLLYAFLHLYKMV